jgi:quinol-cytochrome oxidoreductase complex cytochrome b subunit
MGENLRGWILLGAAIVCLIVFPLWALTQTGWINIAGKIILTLVLLLVLGGTGLFGYICLKAQARKWGAGLIIAAILSALAIYVVWVGHLPLV